MFFSTVRLSSACLKRDSDLLATYLRKVRQDPSFAPGSWNLGEGDDFTWTFPH
jgi:hypothetical protein